jgi:hypothetical protein
MNKMWIKLLLVLISLNLNAQESTRTITNESSLGLTSFRSAQNSNLDTELYFGKHLSELKRSQDKWGLKGEYFYGKTGDQLTARSWLAGLRYDRILSPIWSLFAAENVEGNRFLSFVLRSNTDLGAKYFVYEKSDDKDLNYWLAEAGYRLTYEDRISQAGSTFAANSTSSKGRLATEASYLWTESFSNKLTVEYLKTIGNDYREQVNAEIAAINKLSAILSFKASYLYNYDDTLKDQGFAYNASKTLAVSLIANY